MSSESEARRTLLVLGVGGLLLSVVCLLVATSQWPNDDAVYERDQGSASVAYAALLVGGLGQLALLVAVIGWGVGLGVRWSGLTDAASAASTAPGRFSGVTPLAPSADDD